MELTLNQALKKGVEAHKAGKLQEADRYYTSILKANPKHPDANHNMGVLAVSIGKVDAALPFLKTALESNPKIEQFWLSYIDALIKLGQFDGARQVLAQGRGAGLKGDKVDHLEMQLPGSSPSHLPIGGDTGKEKVEGLVALYNQGQLDECLLQGKALATHFPDNPTIPNILGVVCKALGHYDEAIGHYNKAIEIKPDYAEAYYNLGNLLKDTKKYDEAITSYNQSIEFNSANFQAYINLGSIFNELDKSINYERKSRKTIRRFACGKFVA